jgi:hypothetical protein
MKYIISESQYKRLMSEDKYALEALSDMPDLLNKIIDNFDELEKVNCHEVDTYDYNIPQHVRIYCRYLRNMNINNVKNLRKKSDDNMTNRLGDANDKLISHFNQFYSI